jgi:hypothetical protein
MGEMGQGEKGGQDNILYQLRTENVWHRKGSVKKRFCCGLDVSSPYTAKLFISMLN